MNNELNGETLTINPLPYHRHFSEKEQNHNTRKISRNESISEASSAYSGSDTMQVIRILVMFDALPLY